MKKLLAILLLATLMVGCAPKGKKYILTYRVYYPGNTIEKTVYTSDEIHMWSSRGSNHIDYHNPDGEYCEVETTAPIQIIKYNKIDKN